MFVNVTLEVPMGRQLVIPATGVLQSGTRQIAFVYRTDGYMEPREVRLGARVGDDFIVLNGVKLGEQVVTSANFLIDSESQLQVALGLLTPSSTSSDRTSTAHHPEPSIELTSEPSPRRKGSNVFRVKLVDASGSSISGAVVSVTFFLPAMPQRGMAPLRTFVTLRDKGDGVYEGSGELANGGTWQVTVVARKQGQNIASKQLSIKTAGGM